MVELAPEANPFALPPGQRRCCEPGGLVGLVGILDPFVSPTHEPLAPDADLAPDPGSPRGLELLEAGGGVDHDATAGVRAFDGKAIYTGTLVIYALLPESLRFSRALLLMGGAWALVAGYLIRLLFQFYGMTVFRF